VPLEVFEDVVASPDVAALSRVIECLLFAAGEPLSAKELARTTETSEADVYLAVRALRDRCVDSGLQVVEIANGFQFATRPEYAGVVAKLLAPHANRLSRPALETVAIVAYRQPCTQADVEAVRGVASDGVLKTLVERGLVREAGRKATPGRPILYETTGEFLHYFGLGDINDLPLLDDDEDADVEAARAALVAAGVADAVDVGGLTVPHEAAP
jgi:segregation and condensation protein B